MPQQQCPWCGHCGPRYPDGTPVGERPSAHSDGSECVCRHVTTNTKDDAARVGGRYFDGTTWVCFGCGTAEKSEYEIGGQCVRMTDWQAAAWNSGNATEESLRGATIFVGHRDGCRSYLRDGEVVVVDGLPTGVEMSLWLMCQDERFFEEFLDGSPARRVSA